MLLHKLTLVVASVLVACAYSSDESGRDVRGLTAAVTSSHRLASEAGLNVLQEGGNAMDAAITMAAVLAVARPHMNGIGGDMFLLYYDADAGTIHALNASGVSGSRATLAGVRERAGDAEKLPELGPLSVTVPGAVRGWAEAINRFGTISWEEALQPAVRIAREGLPVSQRLSLDIAGQVEKLRGDAEAARIYLPNGEVPKPSDILRQDGLAETLRQIQENGANDMYAGETARRIVEHLRSLGGLTEPQDFASYRPYWTEPITTEYRNLTIAAFPPNTQGIALLEELSLLRDFDLVSMGHNSPDYLHTISEAIRIAVADRDSSVGDPSTMRVSVDDLLDADRLRALARTIDPQGRAPVGEAIAFADHPNTVYLAAVDSEGNAASLIQSLFHSFGSGIVVPGTGIVLHNRGSLFTLDESHPNVIAPGKRPYHTLCPAIVLRNGKPWLVYGTPGGDGQTHTLVQVLHNILLFGMTPQDAIDAPRLRRYPDGSLSIEDRVPESVRAALQERGYHVRARSGWTAEFGGAQGILMDPETGAKRVGSDRRREAYGMAY